MDSRYITVGRTILYESDILLTPYLDETTIDGAALGRFIAGQYGAAGLRREDVDTGALILTGVALLRENARAIGELFAQEAGRFVAVSAGDNLEATMAAHGSGAVNLSAQESKSVMNIDVGGGTTKIVLCSEGRVREVAALDVGARLVVTDDRGVVIRLEPAGRRVGQALGLELRAGSRVTTDELRGMSVYMAQCVAEAAGLSTDQADIPTGTPATDSLMRTDPLPRHGVVDAITFSGGVSEFIYGRATGSFGDLGALLAEAIKSRMAQSGLPIREPAAGIRATVIGASQYTVQVSGSTIFLSPVEAVPLRSIPVIAPRFDLGNEEGGEILPDSISRAIQEALRRLDLDRGESPAALALTWRGSATYDRIAAFCRGVVDGMGPVLARGHPLVLVFEGDVGGLLGIHLKEELRVSNPVVSIDGVELREFDYIDIGGLIPTSGAVPVVIKSLVFPH